jgi:hypothetical protein
VDDDFVVRWQYPAIQADLIVEKLRYLNPKMSSIEIGEGSIPGTLSHFWAKSSEAAFIDTVSWDKSTREASDLAPFLEAG